MPSQLVTIKVMDEDKMKNSNYKFSNLCESFSKNFPNFFPEISEWGLSNAIEIMYVLVMLLLQDEYIYYGMRLRTIVLTFVLLLHSCEIFHLSIKPLHLY